MSEAKSIEELDQELLILYGRVLVAKIELDNVSALIAQQRAEREDIERSRLECEGVPIVLPGRDDEC